MGHTQGHATGCAIYFRQGGACDCAVSREAALRQKIALYETAVEIAKRQAEILLNEDSPLRVTISTLAKMKEGS